MKMLCIRIISTRPYLSESIASDNGIYPNRKVYIKIKSYDGIISIMNKSRTHN